MRKFLREGSLAARWSKLKGRAEKPQMDEESAHDARHSRTQTAGSFGRAACRVGAGLCAALFLAGAVWNLFYGALEEESVAVFSDGTSTGAISAGDTSLWERQYEAERRLLAQADSLTLHGDAGQSETEQAPRDKTDGQADAAEQSKLTDADAAVLGVPQSDAQDTSAAVRDKLAALRMERDRGWDALQSSLDALEFAEKEQRLAEQETRRYEEQRLELLLRAKGVTDALVLLGEHQANVVVEAETLAAQYEKVYDLVARNTDYAPEEIILVPLSLDDAAQA